VTQTITVPGVGDVDFPDGMSDVQIASALKQNYPEIHQEQSQSATDWAKGAGEAALRIGTGAIAQPVAGWAGIGTAAGNALGLTDADPASVVRSVQGGMTYDPQTAAGQKVSNVAGYLPGKLAQGADYAGGKVTDLTGSPFLGAWTNTAMQAAPLLVGGRFLPSKIPEAPAMSAPVSNAVGLGLKLTPEQAGAGFGARALQSMTNSAKLERTISKQNTPVINGIAKDELGIPQSQSLNQASIEQANKPAYAVMQAVKKTGQVTTDDTYRADIAKVQPPQANGALPNNPQIANLQARYGRFEADDAGNIVDHIRQLRADARDNIKAPLEPDKNATGRAQLQIANALEGQLDRHIQSGAFEGPDGAVAPDLLSQYRQARVQVAKSHTVADSLDGENLDIVDLGKRMSNGAYMDGRLAQLAQAGNDFPRAAQVPSALRNSGHFSGLDPLLLAASVFHPAALTGVVGPPLARAALASNRYQRAGIQGVRPAMSPGLLGTRKLVPMYAQQGLLNDNSQPQGLMGQ
jgi:hypothetical protein